MSCGGIFNAGPNRLTLLEQRVYPKLSSQVVLTWLILVD